MVPRLVFPAPKITRPKIKIADLTQTEMLSIPGHTRLLYFTAFIQAPRHLSDSSQKVSRFSSSLAKIWVILAPTIFSCRYAFKLEFLLETICHALLWRFLIYIINTPRIGTPAITTKESFTSTRNMKMTIKIRLMISSTTLISPLESISDTEFT